MYVIYLEEQTMERWYVMKMCIRDRGWAVRPLKRYASWVQNVVRQFGPYPAWA